MSWVLVIYIYAGAWSNGDSVALTTVPMESRESCEKAGQELDPLVSGSTKTVRYICLKNNQRIQGEVMRVFQNLLFLATVVTAVSGLGISLVFGAIGVSIIVDSVQRLRYGLQNSSRNGMGYAH